MWFKIFYIKKSHGYADIGFTLALIKNEINDNGKFYVINFTFAAW